MIFENDKWYKFLKRLLCYGFPALLFVFDRLNEIWSIPYGTQISGTIFALYVGLAIFLGISKYKYTNAQIDAINVDLSDESEVEE